MAEEKQEMTLEEAFEKLDGILAALESRDITLEESFQNYQRGMELLKKCNEKIDLVEKKMQLINEEGELSDF
ncbi:MAG: exodeoxyribonuclease VII small subunit [Marvinbryantia sp.]|uniref:exodeoxyribonuclease VII small subunit n=1 Tax=Marvinbryantia sp. TaxID=2496532 RepID=UPI0025F85CEC|nr:exodeoxyribonuclease VII small subunit [uncultured Marvinbryantia sp.]